MKKISYMVLVLVLGIILLGCHKTKPELVYLDNQENCFINTNYNAYPFQFAYHKKITDIEISNIVANNNSQIEYQFIEEKDQNDNNFIYKDYYIYGIIFSFDMTKNDAVFQSFDIIINNNFTKTINLNLNVKVTEDNKFSDIKLMNCPMIIENLTQRSWGLKCDEDLSILSINLLSEIPFEHKLYINGLEAEYPIICNKFDEIFISILAENDKSKVYKIYFEIIYEINGKEKKHITDYIAVNGLLMALYRKIDEVIK